MTRDVAEKKSIEKNDQFIIDEHEGSNDNLSEFNDESIISLCRGYISRFIPIQRLTNDRCPVNLPDLTTLTRDYIEPNIYKETLEKIRTELNGAKLFVTLSTSPSYDSNNDQFVDIINVICGTLNKENEKTKTYLINCRPKSKQMSLNDSETFYYKLFIDSMNLLFPENNLENEQIRLLITENKHSMINVYNRLKSDKYRQMIHVICMDCILLEMEHQIMNPSDDLKECCSEYQTLYRELLLGFHRHTRVHGEHFYIGCELESKQYDPFKNLMEWVDFIYSNYDKIKSYFLCDCEEIEFDRRFRDLRQLFIDPKWKKRLSTLKVKYSPLGTARRMLQSQDRFSFEQSKAIFDEFQTKLSKWPDEAEKKLHDKLQKYLQSNVGYQTLCQEVNEQEFFHNAPIVALTRKQCFPRLDQMLKIYHETSFPTDMLHIYSVIYGYIEVNNHDESLYSDLEYRQVFFDLNEIVENSPHFNLLNNV